MPDGTEDREWQPATSEPGELYTIEGRIKALGAFARDFHNDDPRNRRYRRQMRRSGLLAAAGVGLVVAIVVATVALVATII